MAHKGTLCRRSFLMQVTGSVVAAGAGALISGDANAQTYTGVSDSDGGAYADRAGYGRSGGARAGSSGLTDSDSGSAADPAGNGRGSGGAGAQGITDQDSGATADPAGRGRGTRSGTGASGYTDTDSGAVADPAGRGRGPAAQRPAQPDGPVESEVRRNDGMARACNPRC
ncbi:hypothetical protein [Maricaulis maris]|uniref:hypothetical protein n=1 Tax=Maricaulis maris TaxID=74318 RepID=UPI003B8D5AA8